MNLLSNFIHFVQNFILIYIVSGFYSINFKIRVDNQLPLFIYRLDEKTFTEWSNIHFIHNVLNLFKITFEHKESKNEISFNYQSAYKKHHNSLKLFITSHFKFFFGFFLKIFLIKDFIVFLSQISVFITFTVNVILLIAHLDRAYKSFRFLVKKSNVHLWDLKKQV